MRVSSVLLACLVFVACSSSPRDHDEDDDRVKRSDAGSSTDGGEASDAGGSLDGGTDAPDAGTDDCSSECSAFNCDRHCEVTVLARPGEDATGLALHDGHLYWRRGGAIQRVPTTGGTIEEVRTGLTPRSTTAVSFVVANGWAVWGSRSDGAEGVGLYAHRLGSTSVRELSFTPSGNMIAFPGLVVGDETIVHGSGSRQWHPQIAVLSLTTGAERLVEQDADPSYSTLGASDGSSYFYTTVNFPLSIRSVPLAGGTSSEVVRFGDLDSPRALVVDESHVYYLLLYADVPGSEPARLLRVPKGGGTPELVSKHWLGIPQHEQWESPIALFGNDLYVSVRSYTVESGSTMQAPAIRRVAKTGHRQDSPVTVTFLGEHEPRGTLVVDAASVYSLTEAGDLVRVPR